MKKIVIACIGLLIVFFIATERMSNDEISQLTPSSTAESTVLNALNKLEIDLIVENDFELVTSVGEVNIKYESNSDSIIIEDNIAKVIKKSYEQNIILTATGFLNDYSFEKLFNLVVLKQEVENPVSGVLDSLVVPTEVSEDFTLPDKLNLVNITWSSNSESIRIEGNHAYVVKGDYDVNVVLSANATYLDFSATKSFNVKVLKDSNSDLINPLDEIIFNLELPREVTSDFTLSNSIEGYTISYNSNNENLIIDNYNVSVNRGLDDLVVTVIATISTDTYSSSKAFNVLIKKIENPIPNFFNNFDFPTEVYSDFDLVTSFDNILLQYTSTNNAIVIDGSRAIVTTSSKDETVLIVVNATTIYFSGSRSYEVKVLKELMEPTNYSVVEVMDILNEELANKQYYIKESSGVSIAKTSSIFGTTTYEQDVTNNIYKYENDSLLMATTSGDFNMAHHAYICNDQISYRHLEELFSSSVLTNIYNESPTTISSEEYASKFGILPNEYYFTGYIITEDTVLSSSYNVEGDNIIYSLTLDNNKSSTLMKYQMKELGGLSALPVFTSIKLTVTIDKNWNIIEVKSNESYNAEKKVLVTIKPTCTQEIVTTFRNMDLNDETLPDISVFQK